MFSRIGCKFRGKVRWVSNTNVGKQVSKTIRSKAFVIGSGTAIFLLTAYAAESTPPPKPKQTIVVTDDNESNPEYNLFSVFRNVWFKHYTSKEEHATILQPLFDKNDPYAPKFDETTPYPEAPYTFEDNEMWNERTKYWNNKGLINPDYQPEVVKKKLIEVEEMRERGERSLHPWYPSDRKFLDLYQMNYDKAVKHTFIPILPPRVPRPYGKPLTAVIDVDCLICDNGPRPYLEAFFSSVQQKYEIIMYGENANSMEIADGDGRFTTWQLYPQHLENIPPHDIKNFFSLNRPPESTVHVDHKAEHAFAFPSNAVIIRKCEDKKNDVALLYLMTFLDYLATSVIDPKKGMAVYDVCPSFQSTTQDIADIAKERMGTISIGPSK